MSFPQFGLLPPEIRLRIWTFSLPTPRIVDLYAAPITSTYKPCPKPSLLPTTRSTTSDPPLGFARVEDLRLVAEQWRLTFIERIYIRPQDLSHLHICTSARHIALKSYFKINADPDCSLKKDEVDLQSLPPILRPAREELVFSLATMEGDRPYGLLDPSRDIIFLSDPQRMHDAKGGFIVSSLEILLRWLDPTIVALIKRLAVPYYTWRKMRTEGRLGVLLEFRALEELWVSFLGAGESDGKEAGRVGGSVVRSWCEAVGGALGEEEGRDGLWVHVKEVELEVQDDVELLKITWKEWNVPRVGVVKHRGMLVEKLRG